MTKAIIEKITKLKPTVAEFFDQDTNTFSYVVTDPSTKSCAIIDSLLDFDYASGGITHRSANKIIDYVHENNLKLEWIIDTHVHADHISASHYLKNQLGGKIGIGVNITQVQETFAKVFNLGREFVQDGSQFDHLFVDEEQYKIGELDAIALHTPGHTPACMVHVIGDAAFVGDTLFMPEGGTARADFPGGSATDLYESIQKILSLPDQTRLYMCHDYSEVSPELSFQSSVAKQRKQNIQVNNSISESEFVKMRSARDKTLGMPRYILPSLQINMRAGDYPDPENNGLSYLKIPINAFNKEK